MDGTRRLGTRFDTAVNVVIVLTCIVMATAVVKRWNVVPARSDHQNSEISVGDAAEQLSGVSYSAAPLTLVLYVRSSCHYCTDSMPFYRALNEVRRGGPVKLVAVSAEDGAVTAKYLHDNGVTADRIVSQSGRIRATPTLLGVDASGVVKNTWVGKQAVDGQNQILQAVQHR